MLESNSLDSDILLNKYLYIAQHIQTLAEQLNISMQALHAKDILLFKILSHQDQLALIQRQSIYPQLLKIINSEGGKDFFNEKQLLWFALKELKFLPTSELMNMITEGDFIEVFVGQKQVYRSFNYYDICSYPYGVLECVPWVKLFRRKEEWITLAMLEEAKTALINKKVIVSKTPEHIVEETISPLKNKIIYRLKYIIPLHDNAAGESGFVTVIEARLDEVLPSAEREFKMQEYYNSMDDDFYLNLARQN
ncbi:MAG: hypothetical protein ACOYOK_08360 [Pseudobdellovibrionaceae bacterium]